MNEKDELTSVEKLSRRIDATTDDGLVEVEIFDWEEENDRVTVEFLTPTNDRKSETMPFPQAGHDLDEYKFYRLLDQCNISIGAADMLVGEIVYADRSAGWELTIPEKKKSLLERAWSFLTSISGKFVFDLIVSAIWLTILVVLLVAVVVMIA